MLRSCTRRAFVQASALALASGAFALAGCAGRRDGDAGGEGDDAPVPVAVCLQGASSVAHAGVFLAAAEGRFRKRGLDVSIEQPGEGEGVLESVQAGKAEFGIVSQKALAGALGCDEPYSVLAVAALVQPQEDETGEGYPLLLIANDLYLVRREDEAKLFVKSVEEGYKSAAEDPARASGKLLEALQVKEAKQLQAQLEKTRGRFTGPDGAWGRIDQALWDAFFEREWERGAVPNKIPAHHGFSMDYLDVV